VRDLDPAIDVPGHEFPRTAGSTRARAAVLLFLVLVALLTGSVIDLPGVSSLRAWLDAAGPEAWLAVVLGQAVALMTPVPRSALSVLVAAVAGFWAGLALILVGGLLGGLGGFLLSRQLGRGAVVRVAGNRLHRLDHVLGERGFIAVLIARVMPVVPFMLVSYGAGLFGVRPMPYTLGTAVGLLPGSVVYATIGASRTLIASWLTPGTIALLGMALLILVSLSMGVGRRWRSSRTTRPTLRPAGAARPG
jgi:uncharacterized membrane protein YdjX (TVP38/TMEM64 family)